MGRVIQAVPAGGVRMEQHVEVFEDDTHDGPGVGRVAGRRTLALTVTEYQRGDRFGEAIERINEIVRDLGPDATKDGA